MGNCHNSCDSDIKYESDFNINKEAKKLKKIINNNIKNCQITNETTLEQIKLKILNHNRIRFYNTTKLPIIIWITDNPNTLVVKKLENKINGKIKTKFITLSGEHHIEYGLINENRLPITQLYIPPNEIIPIYFQSDKVYMTFGIEEFDIKNEKIYNKIYQINRLLPTSIKFTFYNYHLKQAIGIIESNNIDIRQYCGNCPIHWESYFCGTK